MTHTPPAPPKLYSELASWWPLMSPPGAYAEEAEQYAAILTAACRPKSLLELGSGGGNNASHLKKLFEMTLDKLLLLKRRRQPDWLRIWQPRWGFPRNCA